MSIHNSLACYLYGVGAWGSGFTDWSQLRELFTGARAIPLEPATTTPKCELIPGNEKRRAPAIVKAAVEVSAQACLQAGMNPADLACVFGSGLGDTDITDYLCTQLALPEKQLSPTKFHNSVHNAAAGYWTISTHCVRSANSIAAYQHTAGVSLLEAVLQSQQDRVPVLVSLFDLAARGIYQRIYATDMDFAAALVITPDKLATPPLAKLSLTVDSDTVAAPAWNPFFTQLRNSNPSAQVLPLLHALSLEKRTITVGLTLADAVHLKVLVEK